MSKKAEKPKGNTIYSGKSALTDSLIIMYGILLHIFAFIGLSITLLYHLNQGLPV